MKRLFDIIISSLACIIFSLPFVVIMIIVKSSSRGPIIHWSKRIGKKSKVFFMPKIRTMKINTPQVATHKMVKVGEYIIPFGSFLRKSSLDEIPQFYSVLIGDMSLVGPRPALYNQYDLIELRKKHKIDELLPGITGLAQINGRDELVINEKILLDLKYLNENSFICDIKIILKTLKKITQIRSISH